MTTRKQRAMTLGGTYMKVFNALSLSPFFINPAKHVFLTIHFCQVMVRLGRIVKREVMM